MSLEELTEDVTAAYGQLDETEDVELDRGTRNELAILAAAFGTDPDELVRQGVHALFRSTVDSGDLDFQLRRAYDVTYDEYLSGVTYEEMNSPPERDDDRRYQM